MDSIRKVIPYIGGILVFVGLAMFSIQYTDEFRFTDPAAVRAGIFLGAGVGFLLLSLLFRSYGPNAKYHISYGLTSLFVVGSLVMVYMITKNHAIEYDATVRKIHSLHPRSVQYLQGLGQVVAITAFPPDQMASAFADVFDRFTRASSKIEVNIRHATKDRQIAQALQAERGDVFFEVGERPAEGQAPPPDYRKVKITAFSLDDLTESAIVNGIVEVIRPEKVTIYFLQGHDEIGIEPTGYGPDSGAQPSYSKIVGALRNELAFDVKTVTVLRTGFVPSDCSVLVSAGPMKDLFPLERQAIQRYLEGGGRALFLLDPNEAATVRFDQWTDLLARFGVGIKNNMLLERNIFLQLQGDPTVLLVTDFASHVIVNNIRGAQLMRARTVERLDNAPSEVTVTELFHSSNASWSEDMEKLRSGKITMPEPDQMKSQSLAVAVSMESTAEDAKGPMRMVVIGDADPFRDAVIDQAMKQLFFNAINWLTAREDLIDIPTKEMEDAPVFASPAKLKTLFYILVFGVPGFILLVGLSYVTVRRRLK